MKKNQNQICKNTLKNISLHNNECDKYMVLLNNEYGFNLTKDQLAIVLNISKQTIDRRIKENMNIPAYIKTGSGKKSSYLFPIREVSKYLCSTLKINK